MKHLYRFLARPDPEYPGKWLISKDEVHHLKKVLRLGNGDQAEYFDAEGSWGLGTIEIKGSGKVWIVPGSCHHQESDSHSLSLGLGALRPGFIDDLLPLLTELGMHEIHIFLPEGVARSRFSPRARDRWERILISSARQCRQARIPSLHSWDSLAGLLRYHEGKVIRGFFLHPGDGVTSLARQLSSGLWQESCGHAGHTMALVGPEKGWSQWELKLLREARQFTQASMGPRVLRAFTAAVAAATLLASG